MDQVILSTQGRARRIRALLVASLALLVMAGCSSVTGSGGSAAASAGPVGLWVPYSGATASSLPALGVAPVALASASNVSCPFNTYYRGAQSPWSCMTIQKDNGGRGHSVWVRQGRAGSSGFGYLHAYVDHNLDLGAIEATVLNSSHGIRQPNGRYLYGEQFRARGRPVEYVEVYEERGPGSGSPDRNEMGVVTAYCRNSSYVTENRCPDWVNDTL
ncbi:hypothetical protein [Frankia sp. R82]|uniref:hypothetical protein n=1 Tax=Frankia sp. R82 TaxID=2950553 RepID=UPI002043A1E8|nr:hypothetical protein [Frankia sp. R82]MCM3882834.1 hypothetical protein [Frankia sp. R82]